MPIGVSQPFSVVEEPYGSSKVRTTQGPIDDWTFKEGRPPSHGSPLVPFNYHPWYRMEWAFKKIISPRYTYQGISGNNESSKFYGLPYVTNSPSFITDAHVISIRKMIEQLWAPKFKAHIHLELQDEIFVAPLYFLMHGAFRAADLYEYWTPVLSPTNPDKPYVLSVGGFYSNLNGHMHFWNASASGRNVWKAKIFYDHGGSIREDIGNYRILKVEYSYKLTKYYRKVYSQDSMNFLTMDYNSYIRKLHLPIYDSFEGKWLIGFAVDSGDYWSTQHNTVPYNRGRAPKYELVKSTDTFGNPIYIQQALNIMMSSCTLPGREFGFNDWMGGNCPTHEMTRGYEITYDHAHMLEHSVNRFIQLSVYSEDLGESLPIENAITYFEKEEAGAWTEGTEFEVRCEEADVLEGAATGTNDSKYVTSLIGTRLIPMFRVTYMDMNENIRTVIVSETELYGSDNLAPDNTAYEVAEPDFTECESL